MLLLFLVTANTYWKPVLHKQKIVAITQTSDLVSVSNSFTRLRRLF